MDIKYNPEKDLLNGLTPAELGCLNEIKSSLRSKLEAYPDFFTTWNLLRFCRARKFHLQKTKDMIQNYIDFRVKYDFDRIEKEDFNEYKTIFDNYGEGYFGCDYQGRLVIVDKISEAHPKKIFGVVSDTKIMACLITLYERTFHIIFPILSKIHNKRIDKVLVIIDLKDVSVVKFFDSKVLSFVKLLSKMTSDYYPEILGSSYIINTPMLFKGIWNICSVWLDKKTKEKMHMESGPALGKLKLLLNIDNLPVSLGGKNTEGFSFLGGPWKQEYEDAIKRKSFYLKDRSIEFEYFYTEQERENLEQKIIEKQNELCVDRIAEQINKQNDAEDLNAGQDTVPVDNPEEQPLDTFLGNEEEANILSCETELMENCNQLINECLPTKTESPVNKNQLDEKLLNELYEERVFQSFYELSLEDNENLSSLTAVENPNIL